MIWLRKHLSIRKAVAILGPISQPNRSYDRIFTDPAKVFCALLSARGQLPSYFNGCNYEGADLDVFDTMLATYRPRRIIEVGSGGSTQFAVWRTDDSTQVTCIDPEPRTFIPQGGRVRHIPSRVEDVDVSLFAELDAGDFLFIDSSHTGEEAEYHIRCILPILKPGVLVHHHDVYYPFDIQPEWDEQRLLLQFYLDASAEWEIICGTAFAYWFDHWLFRTSLLSSKLPPTSIPSSLWSRKRGGANQV